MSSFFSFARKRRSSSATLNPDGLVKCNTCKTTQPFTNYRCVKCGNDPFNKPSEKDKHGDEDLTGLGDEVESPTSADDVNQDHLAYLTDVMGFKRSHSLYALRETASNLEAAARFVSENDMDNILKAESLAMSKGGAERRISSSHRLSFRVGSTSSAEEGTSAVENSGSSLASEHAECAICFDAMHCEPSAVFTDSRKRRVCAHFLHHRCAQNLIDTRQMHCPFCRTPFAGIRRVPNIEEDQDAWFDCCDLNGDGELNPREVLDILRAQFPVDMETLEQQLPVVWKRWDPDMDGQIQKEEFLMPNGLLDFIRQDFTIPEEKEMPIPDIREDRLAWFAYVDEDHSGDLDMEEVTRGLIKSLKLSEDLDRARELRHAIANVWCVFDTDGSGEVDREEFLRPGDGVADCLIASMAAGGPASNNSSSSSRMSI